MPIAASSSSARAARSALGLHHGPEGDGHGGRDALAPAGIDQRSPARHPDWLGPDDLALRSRIREATNNEIPIQLKLGAARI
ncbi:MAG: hypothetical protein R3D33_00675 [Hyphomicrobiaceae bacterium]